MNKNKSPISSKYKVKFYSDEDFVKIYLLNANSNIQRYIDLMSKDAVIFAGFESSTSQTNKIPINVFSFYCSSGIFIFQSTQNKGNPQLGEFLKKKENNKFYTFGIFKLMKKLHKMFGSQLYFEIEDIYYTNVMQKQRPKLYNFIEHFAGKPLVDRSVLKARSSLWSEKVLSIEHILRAAYVPYSLAKSFPNLPEVNGNIGKVYFNKKGNVVINNGQNINDDLFFDDDSDDDKNSIIDDVMDYGKISFSNNPLSSFTKSIWNLGATAEIEFFKGTFSKVYLLDAEKDFEKFSPQIANGDEVIFIDFEYVPLYRKEAAPVCLFQFCNSSGAFLFRQRTNKINKALLYLNYDLCCTMCDNKVLVSENELCQHCWNDHSKEVIEFLPKPKKKKGKNKAKKDENEIDDDDNESGNEDENDKGNDDDDEDDNDKNSDNDNDDMNDDESNSSYDENDDFEEDDD